MTKKVLIISHEFPPVGGGAGIVAQDVIDKLINNNVEITLITNYTGGLKEKQFNTIEVRTVPKLRFINYWLKIKKIDLKKYDKIILNDVGAQMVGAMFFSYELLKKTIIYLHGSEPENIYLNPNLIFKILGFEKKYTRLLMECNKIISVSRYMKEKFLSYTGLYALEGKIFTNYIGINESLFFYEQIDLTKKLGIPKEAKTLLSVGRIVKEKGFLEMYDIFKQLVSKDNYHWIIIGEGGYKREFKSLVKKDNLISNIHFLGKLHRDELRRYYSSSDFFWLLSNYEEALGLVYLEAEFCMTTVIARNLGGVKEVIDLGKTGYLIEDDSNVLEILIGDPYPRGMNFDNIIDKFSYEKNTKKLLNLLFGED